MGTPATRITSADFLTPPELRAWQLAGSAAGRIGGVRLQLLADSGGTRLASCYQQVPLHVLPPFQLARDQPALLFLLNPTAGLMDCDAQLIQLGAGANTRAVIAGQSATRIHPSVRGFATQQWDIQVEPGAVLAVLPGPAIPFQGSRYYQRVTINLAPGASLVWGDIWVAGRYARGMASEQFQFAILIQDLTIRRQGHLIFRDRFCWRGPWDRETAEWHFGAGPACGSLFVTGPVEERLLVGAGSERALFRTAAGDSCLRWCGPSEAVTSQLVQTALRSASLLAGGAVDKPWLLQTHDLAPNHWFALERSNQDSEARSQGSVRTDPVFR